jgi:hypothetical protein
MQTRFEIAREPIDLQDAFFLLRSVKTDAMLLQEAFERLGCADNARKAKERRRAA